MSERTNWHWSAQRERGSLLLLRLVLVLYRAGGRQLCLLLMPFIVGWYWLFAATARANSLDYLRKLHVSDPANSPFVKPPGRWQSYRHLLSFGESILDKMEAWLGRIAMAQLQLHGHEHLRRHYQRGLLIVVSHFGNIEFLRALRAEHSQRINVLVYQRHADQFNQFLKLLNPKADVSLLSVDELGLETAILLQQKLDAGEWVILAADRVPVASSRSAALPFLGAPAAWPQGAWILASLLKVPVVALFCYRVGRQFELHVHPLAERLTLPRRAREQGVIDCLRNYIAIVERHCRRAPYQWFNFYDFWK